MQVFYYLSSITVLLQVALDKSVRDAAVVFRRKRCRCGLMTGLDNDGTGTLEVSEKAFVDA